MNKKGLAMLLSFPLLALALYFTYDYFLEREIQLEPVIKISDIKIEGQIQTIDGEFLDLSSHQSPIVLVNFWASWCPPCVEEFPTLIRLIESFKGQVLLIAISNDQQFDQMQKFLIEQNIKSQYLKVVWDDKKAWTTLFNIKKLPETFIVKEGNVIEKSQGYSQWDSPFWKKHLQNILNN